MAECALMRWGNGLFKAYSAGWEPRETVNPMTVHMLESYNYAVANRTPRSYTEFVGEGAPHLDFVFVLADDGEKHDKIEFPGLPLVAVWHIDNPEDVQGTDEKRHRAFRNAYIEVETRCKIFAALRMDGLDRLALQNRLDQIGNTHAMASMP